jgi:hypothetical protein
MKRVTITVPDDLEAAVTEFQQEQPDPPTMGAITLVALREYLTRRGTFAPRRPLRIIPVDAETTGPTDSQDHDRLFADAVARE